MVWSSRCHCAGWVTRLAHAAASTRVDVPDLRKMLDTWVLTVLSVMKRTFGHIAPDHGHRHLESGTAAGSGPLPAGVRRADCEAVPFHGRDQLLADLKDWHDSPAPVDVRLVVGPGGQGKTRLARHLATTLAQTPDTSGRAWVSGFLVPDPAPPAQAVDLAALPDTDAPRLVVVDYAETRTEQLTRLLRRPWHCDNPHPAGVMLLARAAGDRWTRLTDELTLPPPPSSSCPGSPRAASPPPGFRLPAPRSPSDFIAPGICARPVARVPFMLPARADDLEVPPRRSCTPECGGWTRLPSPTGFSPRIRRASEPTMTSVIGHGSQPPWLISHHRQHKGWQWCKPHSDPAKTPTLLAQE